jgi:hypothetical protein
VDGFEQPREGYSPSIHGGIIGPYFDGGGGCGVGVWVGKLAPHFFSFAARMSRTEAPEECICIASRATSMQTAHVMP